MGKKKMRKVLENIKEFLVEGVYCKSLWFVRRHIKNTKRALEYAYFAYNNHDWDHAYIYDLLAYKLKRVKKELANGCAIHEKEILEALDEAVLICRRISDDNYEEKYFEVHNKKWGDVKIEFVPAKRPGFTQLKTSRSGVANKKQQKQERKEANAIYKQAEKDIQKDFDRLGFILKNYSRRWWD